MCVYCVIVFDDFYCSPVPDYVRVTIDTVVAIHKDEPQGDILAFLTGQVSVCACVRVCVCVCVCVGAWVRACVRA